MEEMLTITEFAERIGFNRKAVLKWVKQGKIKSIRLDKEYRIPASEYDRLLSEADPETAGDDMTE